MKIFITTFYSYKRRENMKKVLSIMLIILVVFSSMPMTVFGAENQDNSNDEFTYALSEDNAIITGYNVCGYSF